MLRISIILTCLFIAIETLVFSSMLKIHGSGMDFIQIINLWGFTTCISVAVIPLFIRTEKYLRKVKKTLSICLFSMSLCFIYPFLPVSIIEVVQIISNIIRVIILLILVWLMIYIRINWSSIKKMA